MEDNVAPREKIRVMEAGGLRDVARLLTGTTVPAFTSTLCAPTGLRQIAVARYAFGISGTIASQRRLLNGRRDEEADTAEVASTENRKLSQVSTEDTLVCSSGIKWYI